VNATLPRALKPADVTGGQAVALIAEKAAKGAPAKKAAAKKKPAKKKAAAKRGGKASSGKAGTSAAAELD
jgi:DNA topoisomerase-1